MRRPALFAAISFASGVGLSDSMPLVATPCLLVSVAALVLAGVAHCRRGPPSLQTILLGLKGMKVEESAREIINNLARLKKEFERFN